MECEKMAMLDLATSLKKYCDEYGIDFEDITYDYESKRTLGDYLGICRYKRRADQSRYCQIGVLNIFVPDVMATDIIAWHEFCHAERWIRDGINDGHTMPWVKRVMRKPFKFILGECYLLIAYIYRSIR